MTRRFASAGGDFQSGTEVEPEYADGNGLGVAGGARRPRMPGSAATGHLRPGAGCGDVPERLTGTVVHDRRVPDLARENVRRGSRDAREPRKLQAVTGHDGDPMPRLRNRSVRRVEADTDGPKP